MIRRIIPAFKYLFLAKPAMSDNQRHALQQAKVYLRESRQRNFRMDQKRQDDVYNLFSSAFWPIEKNTQTFLGNYNDTPQQELGI
jgi:hypothetical protein